ncbi:MAG: hypothetical protein J6Z31_04305 [Fibrobacter sp.]|nr:hypothetical protein [Fibrobacter sp.]
MSNWTWLSGLASDLSVWEDELSLADLESEHTFISYAEEIPVLQDLYSLSTVQNADVLVGMDFSALVMLQNLSKRPRGQRWILLAPILNFCSGEDGWPEKQVLLMAKEVQKMPKVALQGILDLFGPADESNQDLWMETALKMKPEVIAEGFEYLAKAKVEEPLSVPNCEVHFGKDDEWITASTVEQAKELLKESTVTVRPKAGHWAMSLIG